MSTYLESDDGDKVLQTVTAHFQTDRGEWIPLPETVAKRFREEAIAQNWPPVSPAPSAGSTQSLHAPQATQSLPSRVYVSSNAVDNLIAVYRIASDGKFFEDGRIPFRSTIFDLVAAPGGREVYASVAVSRGTEIHVIAAGANRVTRTFATGSNSELISLAVSPDAATLYAADRAYQTAGAPRNLALIDPAAGTVRRRVALPGNASPEDVVVHPNGDLVYVTSLQGTQIFDVLTESWAWTIPNSARIGDANYTVSTQGLLITPNGRFLIGRATRLLQGALVGAVVFIDTSTALAVAAVDLPDRSLVNDLDLDLEGTTLAAAGARTVYLINPFTREITQSLPAQGPLTGVSFAQIPLI
jgi:DNA-binding beta-propeller fold protein YncE